nr:Ig-like domain repeat protein [uncultured Methanobacterium sp.]
MKNRIILILAVSIFILIFSSAAYAEDNSSANDSLNNSQNYSVVNPTTGVPENTVLNNNSQKSYSSIKSAIDDASSGDTLLIGPGTYYESLEIEINLNLIGSGIDNTTINPNKDGGWDRAVYIDSNSGKCTVVNISHLTIKDGATKSYGGGIKNDGVNVTLTNVKLYDNEAVKFQAGTDGGGYGGAIYNAGVLTLINCTVKDNSVGFAEGKLEDILGGGIYNKGKATLIVINSTFSGNVAGEPGDTYLGGLGGAIYNDNDDGSGYLTIIGCTFTDNTAKCGYAGSNVIKGGDGGAIYNKGSMTATNNTFNGNTANYYWDPKDNNLHGGKGGAIYISDSDDVNLINNTFNSNTAVYGGSIYWTTDSDDHTHYLNITGCNFYNNTVQAIDSATGKPIVYYTLDMSTMEIIDATLTFADAFTKLALSFKTWAEDIQNIVDNLNGMQSDIVKHTVEATGGAIYMNTNVNNPLFVNDCFFFNNTAALGGAIHNFGAGSLIISNSTFTNNTAGCGAAIYSNNLGPLNVTGSNFNTNNAGTGGAIYYGGTTDHTWAQVAASENIFNGNIAYVGGVCYNGIDGTSNTYLTFNRINGTDDYTIFNEYASNKINAWYNWWGSNEGPGTYDSNTANVDTEYWMVLTVTPNPSTIVCGDNSTVTADMLYDNQGRYHDPQFGKIPDGLIIIFSVTDGSITNSSVMLNGEANTTYTSNVTKAPEQVVVYANVDRTNNGVFNYINISAMPILIIVSPAHNLAGGYVTLAAKVTDTNDNLVNEGTVKFNVGFAPTIIVQVINGYAEYYWQIPLSFSTSPIIANYTGNYHSSAQNMATLTVDSAGAGSTGLSVPAVTGYYGDNVTLTATLVDAYNQPISDKNVTFFVGNTLVGSAMTNPTGQATLTYNMLLNPGTYDIKAQFYASSGYRQSSNTGYLNVLINPTTITVDNITGFYGDYTNLTATLIDVIGNPVSNKTINFSLNNVSVGSAVTGANGVATLKYLLNSTPGAYAIVALFGGNENYVAIEGQGVLNILNRTIIYVSETGDDVNGYGSLQYPFQTIAKALSVANTGNTIYLLPGTFDSLDDLRQVITKNLTITGENPFNTIIDDGCVGGPIFSIASGVNVIICNLTFQNTYTDDYGAIVNSGALSLANCIFNGNADNTNGGAIINYGSLNVNNSTFFSNLVAQYGGAIFNSGNLTVNNSVFDSNTASLSGGAIENQKDATIINSTFFDNDSQNAGAIDNQGTLNIINCVFTANNAINGGAIVNSAVLKITNSTFTNNTASGNGGAIENTGYNAEINIDHTTFSNNSASNGGAIYAPDNHSVPFDFTNCSFLQNHANGNGGAIYYYNQEQPNLGQLNIENSTFAGNSAGNNGGAIFNTDSMRLESLTFTGNSAGNNGGAIYTDCLMNMVHNTLTGNNANLGGGIYSDEDGSCFMSYNRFYNNTASKGKSFYSYGGFLNITNNWWGTNNDPGLQDIINGEYVSLNYDPWLILSINATPGSLNASQVANVNANLIMNSNHQNTYDVYGDWICDGIPVLFGSNIGDVNPVNNVTFMGASNSTFNPNSTPGVANVSATVDNQTVYTAVDVLSADVEVNKTVNNSRPNVGDTVTFTVTVKNNGPDTATNIQIADSFPGGFDSVVINSPTGDYKNGIWYIPELASGSNAILTMSGVVTKDLAGNTTTNTAIKLLEDQLDPNTANDNASASIYVPVVNITVFQHPWYVDADTLTYQTVSSYYNTLVYNLDVWNTGTDTATNVVIKEVLGDAYELVGFNTEGVGSASYDSTTRTITWTIASLPSMVKAVLTLNALVVGTGDNTPNLVVNASLNNSNEYDIPNNHKWSDWSVYVAPSADIQVNQTKQETTEADGQYVTYTITAINNGPNTASNIQITDNLPIGLINTVVTPGLGTTYTLNSNQILWNITSLSNGSSVVLTVKAKINVTNGTFVNTASKTGQGELDWETNNNAATTVLDLSGNYTPQVNVYVKQYPWYYNDKTDTYQTVSGYYKPIVYSILVRNKGVNDATGVVVNEFVGDGYQLTSFTTKGYGTASYNSTTGIITWNIGSIPAGGEVCLNVFALVIATGNNTPDLTVNASLAHVDQNDVQGSPKWASYSIYVPSTLDVSLADNKGNLYFNIISVDSNVHVGDLITLKYKLGNYGPSDATDVKVKIHIPDGLEFVDANVDVGTCYYDNATRTVVWTLPLVKVGDPYLDLHLRGLENGNYILRPIITSPTYLLSAGAMINPSGLTVAAGEPTDNGSTVGGSSMDVNAVNAASNSVGMQNTGLPLPAMFLAIIMVLGGLLIPRRK